jgi:Spy/CpxP family protein refolding chaperone
MKLHTLVVVASLAAFPALAQPPGPPGGPHGTPRHGGPGHPGPGMDRIAEALKLTDAQKASWKELHEAHRAEMKDTFEEGRRLHEAVRAALGEPTPDAAKVGRAVIAVEKHRQRMEAGRRSLEEKLTALLVPEQKTRFETLRAMHGPGPGARGPGHGHGGRGFEPPPGDPQEEQ